MKKRDRGTDRGTAMSRVLIGGFILMLVPIAILVIGTVRGADTLAGLTTKMYRHPLTVSNSVLGVNANIVAMHRYMKDVALARNDEELEIAVAAVDTHEKKVYDQFELIMQRFLGDKSRIEVALKSFKDWKAIRSKVIKLTRNGQRDEAADITKGIGAKHVEMMTVRMESLVDFARSKASEFHLSSQDKLSEGRTYLYGLVAIVVALWGAISFFVIFRVRSAERELLVIKNEAERANLAKSQFLASMSHEMRTPLNAIMGFSDMIVNKVYGPLGDSHYEEYAIDIRDSGEFLVSMVNDVLDLSKIEEGRYDLNETKMDIECLFKGASQMISPQARKLGLRTTIDVADDLPRLWADQRAITQILVNLLSNSLADLFKVARGAGLG